MDPQKSSPYCILCHDSKVLLRQSFKSLSHVSVAACSSLFVATCSLCILLGFSRNKIPLVVIVLFSSACSFCHDKSFFGSLTICLTRSVVLSILCRDNLMCDYWNSYVVTLTIVSRQCFCAASSNWCRDLVFISR